MSDFEVHRTFRDVPRTGVIYVMTEAARLGFSYGNEEWANLGQGAPETGPLTGAPERITSIPVDARHHEYAPVPGLGDLRAAVAELYNRRYRVGMRSQYTAENVAISSGGRLALSRLAATLGRTHVGHFVPDYTAYEELLDLFELFSPIPVPLDPDRGYALSASELRAELLGRGMGAVLFSNPSNPTGRLHGGQLLASWVDVARDLHAWLLIDEFYSHYIWDSALTTNGTVSAAAFVEDVDRDPVVIVDGLTKNWRYPGFRIGWTLGPRHIIEAIGSAGSFLDGGPSHPIQAAAIPLLDPAVADAEAAAIRTHFAPKRELLLRRLAGMGVRIDAPPQGAFYVWGSVARLPEGLNEGMSFFRHALERKVITVPGEFFDVNPGKRRLTTQPRFSQHLRFSFGPDVATLQRGLDAIEQLITEHHAR
jgi:N-succinyldiaminopimelate aminotransferase